jgi:uncharacterized protein (TIGR00369 family)
MEPVYRSRECFVCGTDNPGGLNLAPEREGRKVVLRFTPDKQHLGFSQAVHGGITATLLDEVIGVACGLRADAKCATVALTVTYKRPVLLGRPVRAEGWYVRRSGKLVFGAGRLVDERGQVLATGRGRFLTLSEAHVARFVGKDA